jgi:CMP/dCMP kinase
VEDKHPMIVAVDGPAGAGKSSVCAQVCQKIGWTYVNTGFLYRAVAYLLKKQHIIEPTQDELIHTIDDFALNYSWSPATQTLSYKGENISEQLSTAEIAIGASRVGGVAIVREKLLPLQRALSLKSPTGAIVDGRDIGTVVFPDANLKIYMTASLDERARRRMTQLGKDAEFETIKAEISQRDEQDKGRGTGPLILAEDALVFDTSHMDVDTAVQELFVLLKDRALI